MVDISDIQNSMHPTGVFYRNPTHLKEAERAINQSEIVASINESRRGKQHELIDFKPESRGLYLPGTVKIREMNRDTRVQFFRTLLKFRPNMFVLRISLGDKESYPSRKEIKGREVQNVGSTHPTSYLEIAERIADLFEKYDVVDFVYTISDATPGNFNSKAFAWEASAEEYENDENFDPFLEFEYIAN